MAQTAAQKKAAEQAANKKLLAQAEALKAKLEAQLAALEKQQADAAAQKKADADAARAEKLADMKAKREAELAEKSRVRREAAGLPTNTGFYADRITAGTGTGTGVAGLTQPGSNIFQMLGGVLYFSGVPFTGTQGEINYINGVPDGTKSTTTEDIVPKGPTLALDTFRNTLSLFMGKDEMSQPWVNSVFNAVSKYYKTGSTVDESLNLALQDVRNNPDLKTFTKRFKGLYDLQDKVAKGEAIEMPTIAEFFKSQQALGDVMRSAGFQDLATQEFLGDVLGTGKSVAETTALINDVFAAIDNAPAALKKDLETIAPGADRTAIAKALLLGKEGAAALNKQIAATTVFSAAKSQGLNIDMATAADYAARGYGYDASLTGFGNVALGRGPLEKLTEISTGKAVTPEAAQTTMQQSIFEKNVTAQEQIRIEAEREAARYSGRSGTMGSRSLASRNRADRVI
jgi:hypothetical protein